MKDKTMLVIVVIVVVLAGIFFSIILKGKKVKVAPGAPIAGIAKESRPEEGKIESFQKQVEARETKPVSLRKAIREIKVEPAFRELNLGEAVSYLSRMTGVKIVIDGGVSGELEAGVAASPGEVSLAEALNIMLGENKLEYLVKENYVFIVKTNPELAGD